PGLGGPFAEMGCNAEGAFVEFDAPLGMVRTRIGPRRTGIIPTGMDQPLLLLGLTPSFREGKTFLVAILARKWRMIWGNGFCCRKTLSSGVLRHVARPNVPWMSRFTPRGRLFARTTALTKERNSER